MKGIESEYRKAEHLLYVSLKYTKTADVIRNVIIRWQSTLDLCIDRLLMRAKRLKKIKKIPTAPLAKTDVLPSVYKDPIVKGIIELYLFFRKLDTFEQIRQGEFRKNVALVIIDKNKELIIDIPKLYEWNEKIKQFIEYVREKV
mgnify:FL=1